MRIFWQSFVDSTTSAAYLAKLADYLNEIAAPGTSVQVEGLSPPDRDFGRLSEFRCAVQAVDNGLAAEESGFDAYVMGAARTLPGSRAVRAALGALNSGYRRWRGDAACRIATWPPPRSCHSRCGFRGLALRTSRSIWAHRTRDAGDRHGLSARGFRRRFRG